MKPYTVASDSRVGPRAQLGPFSHLRPESDIGEDAHVGNFVETKKTRMDKGAKANHLAYLGDGIIGAGANIGAGTIFCNYDGFQKHTTTIEAGAFIGSDSQLVAPVRVGEGAYVGTGTTVTRDVPAERARALARETGEQGGVRAEAAGANEGGEGGGREREQDEVGARREPVRARPQLSDLAGGNGTPLAHHLIASGKVSWRFPGGAPHDRDRRHVRARRHLHGRRHDGERPARAARVSLRRALRRRDRGRDHHARRAGAARQDGRQPRPRSRSAPQARGGAPGGVRGAVSRRHSRSRGRSAPRRVAHPARAGDQSANAGARAANRAARGADHRSGARS